MSNGTYTITLKAGEIHAIRFAVNMLLLSMPISDRSAQDYRDLSDRIVRQAITQEGREVAP